MSEWLSDKRDRVFVSQIHYITENIRCCGAGTAADTEFTTALISSNMELHALNSGRTPRVVTAMTMLKQYLFRSLFLTHPLLVLYYDTDIGCL